MADQRRRLNNVDLLVDYHMAKLECFRVTKFKTLLQEFSWCQMVYHTAALEVLPATSKSAVFVDPAIAVEVRVTQ